MTTITVNVTAEDTSSRMTYTVKVYRNRSTLSTEARLSSLSLSDGTLDPSFSRTTNSYDVRVGHDVDEVTVSYTTVDTAGAASVAIAATGTGASADGKEVTLANVGTETVITVTVTPESGDANDDVVYTITIYRVRSLPSADATLTTLTLAVVPTSPTIVDDINLGTSDFSARVENATTHVTVTAAATAAANGAEVDISPADADTSTDGAGHQVALTAGMITTITVTVTAEDGTTTKAYMVEVYRERLDESEDATLSALSLSDGMLDPTFMSDRMEYDARVGSDVSEVTVSSTPADNLGGVSTAVSATEGDGTTACDGSATTCDVDGMKVTLGGPGSETIISVAVTPESGETDDVETYMITVYRERRNLETINTLSAFTIKDVNPSVAADANGEAEACGDETTRTVCNLLTEPNPDVGYRVRTVRVIATPMDTAGGAVARITSPPDKDMTTAAHEIDLTAGAETTITVEVMAEDPNAPTRTYTANVYRQGLTLDDDATLSSLMLSGVDLMYMDDNDMEMTGFMSDVMEYTADAPYSTMQTTVTAMATHIGAQSSIMVGTLDNATPRVFTVGSDANSEMDGDQVDLTIGG